MARRVSYFMSLICGLSVQCVAIPSYAQIQEQYDRINELALFAVNASMCDRLGMNVAPDFGERIDDAIRDEVHSWGGNSEEFDKLSHDALNRQLEIAKIDLKYYSDHLSDDKEMKNVRNITYKYGKICIRAAGDVFFRKFITLPLNYNFEQAVTDFTDKHLEDGGLASWQTPYIRARGDLLMLAGACRKIIGPDRTDILLNIYSKSKNVRERNYYTRSFDRGLNDPEIADFDITQCNRGLASLTQKVKTAQLNK